MLSLLARAHLFQKLTPGERALLRALEYLLVSAIVAGLVAVGPLISTQNVASINWTAVLSAFATAAVMALYAGVSKYFKAFGDPPLPTNQSSQTPEPDGETGA